MNFDIYINLNYNLNKSKTKYIYYLNIIIIIYYNDYIAIFLMNLYINIYIKISNTIFLILLLFIHFCICQPVGRLAADPIQLLSQQLKCQTVYIKLNTDLTLYIIPFLYSYILPELLSDIFISILTVGLFITVDYYCRIGFVVSCLEPIF